MMCCYREPRSLAVRRVGVSQPFKAIRIVMETSAMLPGTCGVAHRGAPGIEGSRSIACTPSSSGANRVPFRGLYCENPISPQFEGPGSHGGHVYLFS